MPMMQEFQNSVHWNVIYVEPRAWITCNYNLLNSNLAGFSDVNIGALCTTVSTLWDDLSKLEYVEWSCMCTSLQLVQDEELKVCVSFGRWSSGCKKNTVCWIVGMEVSKGWMWVSEIVNSIDMLPFLVALSTMFVYANNFLISILRSKATLLKNIESIT